MLGVARKDEKRNEWIRAKRSLEDMIGKVDMMKWPSAGTKGE